MNIWDVHAVKYADRNARTRADSFIFDDNHDAPHAMDFFMWVLRNGSETILVDTGYDGAEMCHDTLKMPYTATHICSAIKRLYAGKVVFYDGEAQVADGVTVHCIGGHSRGLQAVRVRTKAGWLVLASDAAHFWENLRARKPFPIVVDVQNMLDGFDTLERLASHPDLIIPGHDPLVRDYFPQDIADHITRLDHGPMKGLPS